MAAASESPYLGWPGRPRLSVWNQLALGLLWFPNNILWTGLLLIVMPERVLDIVGPRSATAVLSWTNVLGVAVAIVFAPIFGALSDSWRSRLGRRRPMMILGTLPAVVFLLVLAYAPSVLLFLVGLIGVQFFNNFAQGAYQGLIPDLVPPEQRGAASGYMAFYNQLGVIVGGLLAAFTAPVVFAWSVAAATLAALGVTVTAVQEPPSLDAPPPDWAEKVRGFLVRGERYRDFRWVWFTRIVVLTGLYILETYLFYYLKFVLRLPNPKTEVFLLLIILSATALLTALLAGYVSDRLRRRRLIVCLSGVLQGLCALLFILSHSLLTVELAAVLFGLGYGAYQSVDWALAVDTLPGGSAAKDMGVWGISTTGAQLVAQFLGFLLAQAVIPALGVASAYRILFAAAGVLFVAGSVLIWQVRKIA
jgi:MFS family permease